VAEGLAEVHTSGILHRDIKPDNILLDPDRDVAVLSDFGLAVIAGAVGGCSGTPGYMAPEVFRGGASERTDVFALAATLFYLVTGRKPFDSRDLLTNRQQAESGIPEPALGGLPTRVAAIIRAGLDPNPDRRPNLAEFTAMLHGCHTGGLADRLRAMTPERPKGVKLQVTIATANEKELIFRTVFTGEVTTGTPLLRCESVVRIEAAADADGYLTVLNLSSGGEVVVLFPNPRMTDNRIQAGRPQRLTVKLTPPGGTDHAVLVWTPGPCPIAADAWRKQIESGRLSLAPVQDRVMALVDVEVPEPPRAEYVAAILGIEHGG
jgi:hypothetical protein